MPVPRQFYSAFRTTTGEYTIKIAQFWVNVSIVGGNECWIWNGALDNHGYGSVSVKRSGKFIKIGAHRASFYIKHGALNSSLNVLHNCDTPRCVNPNHLYEGTDADNVRDCVSRGRNRNGSLTHPERMARGDRSGARLHPERRPWGDRNGSRKHPESRPKGESHACAKLTASQVLEIRARKTNGETYKSLSNAFSISKSYVWEITSRKKWASI